MPAHQRRVLFGCGVAGWALCAATIGISRTMTTLDNALVIHAVAAPLIFAALGSAYFRAYPQASIIPTAAIWVGTVILLDLLVVAPLIEHSLAMFQSPVGTWIPFALIFLSTVAVGHLSAPQGGTASHSSA